MCRILRFSTVLFLLLFTLQSCRKDLNYTTDPSVKLSFSTDTVLFDTVFTTVGSTTKRLKIYNRNNKAINISKIDLPVSNAFAVYRLNVDGFSGNHLKDIEIPGNDSIFAFIEITVNPSAAQLPFIINESLVFETNGNRQKVEIEAFGQNAHFYNDSVLTGNITWVNDLPYVIYGGILIDTLSTLNIDPGVRVYMHKDAIVLAIGTLNVNGTRQDSVTFQGDRRELQYYNEPGQWNSIQFLPGSVNNKINYATIKGSTYGVIAGTFPLYGVQPEVEITNSIIKYSTVTGIFGINAKINAYNNLVFACGQFALFTQFGGTYEFVHNTFGQTNNSFNRQTPGVSLTDFLNVNNIPVTAMLTMNFKNNIVWGGLKDEYYIESRHATPAAVTTENNLLKTSKTWSASNVINRNPLFIDPSITLSNNYTENYRLEAASPAKGKAEYLSVPAVIVNDADGIARLNPSTIGCYE